MLRRTMLSILAALMLALPVFAQEAAPDSEAWQSVITGQIQAFRDHDAAAALSYAGQDFRTAFDDPRQFYMTIIASGYAPIAESVSHSFGSFKLVTPDEVLQDVTFTGGDQSLYRAIYVLDHEPDGWRVHAVQLVKTGGLGV